MIRTLCSVGKGENLPALDEDEDEDDEEEDGEEYIPPDVREARGRLEFSEDDLASDESVWKLYERWCVHYDISSTPAQKERYFHTFKECLHSIHKFNQEGHTSRQGLNHFSDIPLEENRRINKHFVRIPEFFRSPEEKKAWSRKMYKVLTFPSDNTGPRKEIKCDPYED